MASNLKLGALLFLALWVDLICAHREYAVGIPNGVRIPCPPDVDCGGAGYCFAAGHERCLSSETTEFGDDVEDGWTSSACRADSDNDGWTNGDELGDPCCIWRRGETPTFMEGLSHPGSSVSKPIRSSCSSNEQVLQPPLALKVVETTDTKVALEWGFPEESCVCWNTVCKCNFFKFYM